MAQRINISVPDELHSELEKQRERLNVSRICQEALRKELHRLELQEAPVGLGTERIEMLRAEKAESEEIWRGLGAQHGRQWAVHQAHYPDLRYLATLRERQPASERQDFVDFELPDEVTGHPGVVYRQDWWHIVEARSAGVGFFDEEAYKKGWLEGVEAVWKQVKDLL